jgi:hypothetical protein
MRPSAVQVRDGLTSREETRHLARIARDAIALACRDARLRDQLDELNDVPVTTINQDAYKVMLLKLLEIASTAERIWFDGEGNEKARGPDYPTRLRALEILADQRIREGELLLKAQGLGLKEPDQAPKTASGHENVLTRDEAVELLQARRHRQAVGG